jgi:hypothetical protein
MSWNWLGWLLWILAIAFLGYVIHYIRVQQLMLIAKTRKAFDKKLFIRYVGLLVVAVIWLGAMSYLTFFRQVDLNNQAETQISTKYYPLQINNHHNDYYYVLATHGRGGNRAVVSYSYWSGNNKYMTPARFGSVADSNRIIPLNVSALPWNKKELKKQDSQTGHAFAAVMSVHYRNTPLNGIGLRANRESAAYTILRVPSAEMVAQR